MTLSLGVMSFSCNENGDPTPDNTLKIEDIVGTWNFESLVYDGKTWTDCGWDTSNTVEFPLFAGWVDLDLTVSTTENDSWFVFNCEGNDQRWTFTIIDNGTILNIDSFGNTRYQYEIISYDLTSPIKEVVLKLIASPNLQSPDGVNHPHGTFTYTK